MQVKQLKKVRISLLLFAVLVSAKCSFAQSFFKENKEVFSNYNLFSDTITTRDTIVFINSMNSGKFPSLRKDTVSYHSGKPYFRWNFSSDNGASIAYHKSHRNPYKTGLITYYYFQVKQEEIFGKDVLIFHYEDKLYFFEIIENRPAPHNSGSLIALVKL